MKRFLLLFLSACGSDQFAMDGGADGGGDSVIPVSEGGTQDSGGDGAMPIKPRFFASVLSAGGGTASLVAWDDPDSISMPRAPDVKIDVPGATDVVTAKRARAYVAAGTSVLVFDKPLELASMSTYKSFDKNQFLGLSGNDSINLDSLAYEAASDMLVATDPGKAGAQTWKPASSMPIPTTASAQIVGNSKMRYPLLAENGDLYLGTDGSTTLVYKNAPAASGAGLTTPTFLIGTGRLALANGRLFIGTFDSGVGGAEVFVYAHPVVMAMPSPIAQVKTAFGGPAMSYLAADVATSTGWTAVGVWKDNTGSNCYICILPAPGAIDSNSTCQHTIPMSGNEGLIRMYERKGSLYVSVASMAGSRIDIYRNPMSDMKPTVKLDVGMNRFASGFATVE